MESLLSILRWLRIAMIWAVDTAVMLKPVRRNTSAAVIRLDAIGDFVIWLQSGAADIAIELRRTHHPVALLANSTWAPLAAALGVWDEVIPIDPARFVRDLRYRISTLLMVRSRGFSIAVQPRAARALLRDDALVRACGATVRVGSAAVLANMTAALRAIGDRAYSTIIPADDSPTVHESLRNLAFARAFCKQTGVRIAVSALPPSADLSFIPPGKFIAMAVGASWSARQWPIEKFAKLLSELHTTHGMPCALVGSAAEQVLVSRLRLLTDAPIQDFCGRLSLMQSVELIRRSMLLVTNDSGPMHIAAWCGTPVVGITGGGQFGWFAPYPADFVNNGPMSIVHRPMPCFHCNWLCKFKVSPGHAVPCIEDIEVSEVADQARRLLPNLTIKYLTPALNG